MNAISTRSLSYLKILHTFLQKPESVDVQNFVYLAESHMHEKNICCTSSHQHRASSLSREPKREREILWVSASKSKLNYLTTKFSVFKKKNLFQAHTRVCLYIWCTFLPADVKVKTDFPPKMKTKIFPPPHPHFMSALPKCVFLVYCEFSFYFWIKNNFHHENADCKKFKSRTLRVKQEMWMWATFGVKLYV